jgi:flagellar hook protein FlgE
MLLSLDSGIGALSQLQNSLNNTANNIANVQTTGYKSSSVTFADTFSQTIGLGGAAGPMQIGTGVGTASIRNDWRMGAVSSTGNPNDMAIDLPNGFFLVKDPASGNTFATRDGSFSRDTSGYLVTSGGLRVQGYTTGGTGAVLGDIQIDNANATRLDPSGNTVADAMTSYSFGKDGTLNVKLESGATISRGQILLQNFTSPQQLEKVGNNLYAGLANAGPLAAPVPPGTGGVGLLQTGALEMSNVDLARELTTLITTQRAYEANSKAITTSDEILNTLVNLKR